MNRLEKKSEWLNGCNHIIHKYLNEFKSLDIDNAVYGNISDEDKEIIIECSLYFAHAVAVMNIMNVPIHIILDGRHAVLNSGDKEFLDEAASIADKIRNQQDIDRFEFEFVLTILTFSKAMLEIKEKGGKICSVAEDGSY